MFINIFIINKFGQQCTNDFVNRFNLSITLWVISCRVGMFEQKMINKILNCFINEMSTLICDNLFKTSKMG